MLDDHRLAGVRGERRALAERRAPAAREPWPSRRAASAPARPDFGAGAGWFAAEFAGAACFGRRRRLLRRGLRGRRLLRRRRRPSSPRPSPASSLPASSPRPSPASSLPTSSRQASSPRRFFAADFFAADCFAVGFFAAAFFAAGFFAGQPASPQRSPSHALRAPFCHGSLRNAEPTRRARPPERKTPLPPGSGGALAALGLVRAFGCASRTPCSAA